MSDQTEFKVEWSNTYDAESAYDALLQALGDLETVIKYRQGPSAFTVYDAEKRSALSIDIEFEGGCEECGEIYELSNSTDHCTVCGTCNEHCYAPSDHLVKTPS